MLVFFVHLPSLMQCGAMVHVMSSLAPVLSVSRVTFFTLVIGNTRLLWDAACERSLPFFGRVQRS
jgi:hypothetical protein